MQTVISFSVIWQPGSHVIQLNSVLITPKSVTIEVEKAGRYRTRAIKVTELNATEDISMIGVIDAGMVDDDVENASQDVSSTVILSNDVFLKPRRLPVVARPFLAARLYRFAGTEIH